MGADRQEKKKVNRSFGLMAVLGVLLVLAGLVGLVYTGLATLTSMFLFGWLLLIGGVVGLVQAVQSRGSSYFWLAVIVAAINIAAGFVILRRPEASAEALTMFAALLFLTGGLFRLVGALVVRGANFGLALVQGAFGVLLGFLILSNWPGNSLYVIGTFFSLALLFDGLSLIAMGMGARRILGLVREDEPGTEAGAAQGTREADEKRPAEDQEQTNN
ncbi:HdeD family acid-resistance protein [Streptomyces erythrochromogenes]|uniref:HdeD family acid-resistance protein n=1 Tax=Streptomyces erythrochromogenes TaxID=285574 RepID=A0ABZ1Q7C8_9ACTN|nr:HdeD family acid-resistance protein [Streptomyces erythrochromogenes]MCX5582527.1 HdeD family acid-resistance protein [Streptomyces erythrochromogenes]